MLCPRNIHWFSMIFPFFFRNITRKSLIPSQHGNGLIQTDMDGGHHLHRPGGVDAFSLDHLRLSAGFPPARGRWEANRQWVHWPNNPTTTWWFIPRIVSGIVHPSDFSGLTLQKSHLYIKKHTLWLCQNSYWKWPVIVDFPIKNGDFP